MIQPERNSCLRECLDELLVVVRQEANSETTLTIALSHYSLHSTRAAAGVQRRGGQLSEQL